jgi:tripartite-type tricarboxylate transporter receptor subunit TctC
MALWVVMPDATAYPTKPIRLIVPFPPGGPTDVFARLVGQQLGEKLGQPVVVENRAGAATMIGSSLVARAPADGHTLLFTASTLVISVQLQKDKPFDPLKDFMPVSPILAYPFYLVVNNALPVTNVQELIAYGKANPGKLSYGSVGTGSGAHLVAETFKNQAGFEAVHIPYKGAAEFLQAVQTGQVHFVFDSPGSAQPTVAAGRARGLAVTSAKRWVTIPEVPTMQEAGLAGFEKGLWLGVLAPAGTPAEVVGRLHASMTEILQTPDVRARIEKAGFQVLSEPPEVFRKRLARDAEQWGEVIRRNRISAD